MEHTDEETLTLMALGESPSPPDEDHVRSCARCARELEALRHVVLTMKAEPSREGELLTPPADLWDSIASELRLPSGHESADPRPAAMTEPAGGADDRPAVPARAARPGPRRLGRLSVALAACAALLGAAAGSGITWWVIRDDTNVSASDDGRRLDSLQPNSAGYARLSGASGHRTLTITVEGLPRTAGYFEVWLMDRTHTKLVSMGVLNSEGRASLPVPNNIDLREYSVVDVSVQPYNGKPDHSGDSIVRGPYAG
ncbi:anti-sigma factor [Streptomyces aquilus]|uniref:anti-sigma factor n=1 Tax=Streptomyces aquilus TaxID=2548456 RepID=UPI0036835951